MAVLKQAHASDATPRGTLCGIGIALVAWLPILSLVARCAGEGR